MATFTAAKINTCASHYVHERDVYKKAILATRHAGPWHKAETIAIHRNAQQARKWMEYEDDSALYPSLTYDAVLDGRTRISHRKMDGISLPLRHAFWNTHFPPNGYGCRCDVRQSRSKQTSEKEVKRKKDQASVPAVFKNNSAKSGTLFNNHPYKVVTEKMAGNEQWVFKNSSNHAVAAFLSANRKKNNSAKDQ